MVRHCRTRKPAKLPAYCSVAPSRSNQDETTSRREATVLTLAAAESGKQGPELRERAQSSPLGAAGGPEGFRRLSGCGQGGGKAPVRGYVELPILRPVFPRLDLTASRLRTPNPGHRTAPVSLDRSSRLDTRGNWGYLIPKEALESIEAGYQDCLT